MLTKMFTILIVGNWKKLKKFLFDWHYKKFTEKKTELKVLLHVPKINGSCQLL